MPSEFVRGIKFGMGCALGGALILAVFLLGLSMCAGELQRRLLEELQEQMRDMVPFPPKRDRADLLHQYGRTDLPFSAAAFRASCHQIEWKGRGIFCEMG